VQALRLAGPRVVALGASALVIWSLWIAAPAMVQYGGSGSPAFRAFSDVMDSTRSDPDPGRPRDVAMHAGMRRIADWLRGAETPMIRASHGHEWLALVETWRQNPAVLISYVADPRRTDLALIDPASRRGPTRYRGRSSSRRSWAAPGRGMQTSTRCARQAGCSIAAGG
jgi:hypothetical protein